LQTESLSPREQITKKKKKAALILKKSANETSPMDREPHSDINKLKSRLEAHMQTRHQQNNPKKRNETTRLRTSFAGSVATKEKHAGKRKNNRDAKS